VAGNKTRISRASKTVTPARCVGLLLFIVVLQHPTPDFKIPPLLLIKLVKTEDVCTRTPLPLKIFSETPVEIIHYCKKFCAHTVPEIP
jgi:hypothetical protein